MNLLELSTLIQSEQSCEEYLRKVGILKTFTECPKCKSIKMGRIRRNKIRCYSCRYEWHLRKGSVLEGMILEYSKFIACIKMFEMGLSANECVREINLAKETVLILFFQIRKKLSISNNNPINTENGKIVLNEVDNQLEVILEKNNIALEIGSKSAIIKMRKSKNDLNQISYKYSLYRGKYNREKKNNFDLISRFWRYSLNKLKQQNFSNLLEIYLYLNELNFRYQNRKGELFEEIIKKMI